MSRLVASAGGYAVRILLAKHECNNCDVRTITRRTKAARWQSIVFEERTSRHRGGDNRSSVAQLHWNALFRAPEPHNVFQVALHKVDCGP